MTTALLTYIVQNLKGYRCVVEIQKTSNWLYKAMVLPMFDCCDTVVGRMAA